MKTATRSRSRTLFQPQHCGRTRKTWPRRSVSQVTLCRLGLLLDLRGELRAAVELQHLDEQLHLHLRRLALPEALRHIDEQTLRFVSGDALRDELEQQVGRGVDVSFRDVATRGLDR